MISRLFKTKEKTIDVDKLNAAFDKTAKVLTSCKTSTQLEGGYKMMVNFFMQFSTKISDDQYQLTGEVMEAFEALKMIYKDQKVLLSNE